MSAPETPLADDGKPPGQGLTVFISYSRKDAAFAQELVAGLKFGGFTPSLDTHDIAPGEDWQARLSRLIEQADTLLFVISPDAVASERCAWEVARGEALKKRLMGIVWRGVEEAKVPPGLTRLNYIYFDKPHSFGPSLSILATALRTDLDWIREHTRLQDIALRWDARGRAEALLIRGEELLAARNWLGRQPEYAPEPHLLTLEFIQASEDAEAALKSAEHRRLDEMAAAQAERQKALESAAAAQKVTARFQRRAGWLLAGLGVLLVVMLINVLWQQRQTQQAQSLVFTALAALALKEEQYDSALRYAVQAYPPAKALWPIKPPGELESILAGGALASRFLLALRGHGEDIFATAVSPDGTILTTSQDKSARLWEAATGRQKAVLKGHAEVIRWGEFSPIGDALVTASDDGKAILWDPKTGDPRGVLEATGYVYKAVFSPDGKVVATASSNGAILWDVATQNKITLPGHFGSVRSAAFSRDGSTLVTSDDRMAHLWDVATGQEITRLTGHEHTVWSAAFSPDGQAVVTASEDRTARLWTAVSPDGQAVVTAPGDTARLWSRAAKIQSIRSQKLEKHKRPVWTAAFSPDGRTIATTSAESTVRLWDRATGEQTWELKGHKGPVWTAVFSPDGEVVATASDDKAVLLWDVSSGVQISQLQGHTGPVRCAAFSPNGEMIVTGSNDRTARLWDAATAVEIYRHAGPVQSAAFSPDGTRIATAASNGTAILWDVASQNKITLPGHAGSVRSAAFSRDGSILVTSDDRTARLWDAATGKEITRLAGHEHTVSSAAFSPDGRALVTASEDRTMRLWDIASGSSTVFPHSHAVLTVAFSPDGKSVLTGSQNGHARSWDAQTGKEIMLFVGHYDYVWSVSYSPDGASVLTASADNTARLWDAHNGEPKGILDGHNGPVRSAAFSPQGNIIATTSEDNTTRLWHAGSLKQIAMLTGHTDLVTSVAFSPDGNTIVTASEDATVRRWDLRWLTTVRGDDLRDRVCNEKLAGAQEFTAIELQGPMLRGVRNPCLGRGLLAWEYWTRMPGELWRSARGLLFPR